MENKQETGVAAATAAGLVVQGGMRGQIEALFNADRKGFEEKINPGEITIPRAKMLQGLSEEVQQDGRKFCAGMIINSITKEEMVKPMFIPIKRLPNSWVRYNARDDKDPNFVPGIEKGAVVWRSNDPQDPRVIEETKFGDKGEAPKATAYLNFLCYFQGFTIPCVLSFGRTSYTAGKNFLTMAFGYGGDMFSRRYRLIAKQETNAKGTFYQLEATPDMNPDTKNNLCTADELAIGEVMYKAFANVAVKVDEEKEEHSA